jgi:zinc protease
MPAAPPSEDVVLPDLPVEKFEFDNGLTLIVREDRSAPVVSLQGWCQTGSVHEGEWLGAGLSHILEHMLFKGTQKRAPEAVACEIGALGGQINAYTSFDRTVYYIDCPGESADGCLDVLMDVVAQASIPEDEFASEQEVIRREFAMGEDDPDRVASHEMFSTAFSVHPYGVPVIGHRQIFDQLTRDDVLEYYHRRYAPNNLFFVVVGDVDAAAVREQMGKFFESIPRRPVAPIYVPEEPPQLGRRDSFKAFATPVSKLWLAWRIPGVTHPDMPALDVLASILGDGRSSRLHREVRERQGVVHRVDAFSYTPADGGLFAIGADLDPSRREAAESAIVGEIDRLLDGGVSEQELSKSRRMALSSQLGTLVTMSGQAADLGSNWMLARNLGFTRDYLQRISKVDAASVSEVARRYLVDGGLSTIEVGPERELPVVNVSTGLSAAKRELIELDNGLQVVIEEDRRLPLFSMCAAFRSGLLAEDENCAGITSLHAANLFQGSESRSAEELAEALESLGGSAGAGGGNNSFYISAGLMSPDAAKAFEVVAEVLREPAFPDDALSRERDAQLAAIDEEDERPLGAAMTAARRALFGEHPFSRSRLGTRDSVAGLSRDGLIDYHQQYAAAKNGVLAICGDIDMDRAKDLAEEHFGGLSSGERAFGEVESPNLPTELADIEVHRDKEQAVVVVAVPGIDLASPKRSAVAMIDETLSGMDGRLFARIREELGLAYYTGATQLIGRVPGALLFYVGTRPDAAEQVQQELLAELKKLATSGIDDAELERAKRIYAGKHCIEKQASGARAQGAALDVLYDLGADFDERMLEQVHALDRGEVSEVAAELLGDVPKVCVRVTPG